MSEAKTTAAFLQGARFARVDIAVYAAVAAAAVLLWWLCNWHTAELPFVAPWEFSFAEFLSAWLIAWWYLRGLALTTAHERPSLARRIAFFVGLIAIYIVLETRFEYLAEHQFFFNRLQHVTMHHLGPFLMALAWPGETLGRGAPRWVVRVARHPILRGLIDVLQQPIVAGVLFVGLIFFWLVPPIHFRAMLDPRLFTVMNWSMLLDGVLFWFLVLDPRPSPPARISFGARVALAGLVMFPQIAGGAVIALAQTDIYPYYDLCGRIFPDLGPLYDQTIGGVIIWIPPSMMSVIAVVLVLNLLRKSEERTSHADIDADHTGPVIDTSAWTGR
ncbi:MAG TPA: cytochrome c oxidase assembly protein [Pseudolabrys sp.]|jgi:putative membrane protein|nr:cytochrome c oxidase assembly protein [Pseudolabrys sp.]